MPQGHGATKHAISASTALCLLKLSSWGPLLIGYVPAFHVHFCSFTKQDSHEGMRMGIKKTYRCRQANPYLHTECVLCVGLQLRNSMLHVFWNPLENLHKILQNVFGNKRIPKHRGQQPLEGCQIVIQGNCRQLSPLTVLLSSAQGMETSAVGIQLFPSLHPLQAL